MPINKVNKIYRRLVGLLLNVNLAFIKKEKVTATINPIKLAVDWLKSSSAIQTPKNNQCKQVFRTPIDIYFKNIMILIFDY